MNIREIEIILAVLAGTKPGLIQDLDKFFELRDFKARLVEIEKDKIEYIEQVMSDYGIAKDDTCGKVSYDYSASPAVREIQHRVDAVYQKNYEVGKMQLSRLDFKMLVSHLHSEEIDALEIIFEIGQQ